MECHPVLAENWFSASLPGVPSLTIRAPRTRVANVHAAAARMFEESRTSLSPHEDDIFYRGKIGDIFTSEPAVFETDSNELPLCRFGSWGTACGSARTSIASPLGSLRAKFMRRSLLSPGSRGSADGTVHEDSRCGGVSPMFKFHVLRAGSGNAGITAFENVNTSRLSHAGSSHSKAIDFALAQSQFVRDGFNFESYQYSRDSLDATTPDMSSSPTAYSCQALSVPGGNWPHAVPTERSSSTAVTSSASQPAISTARLGPAFDVPAAATVSMSSTYRAWWGSVAAAVPTRLPPVSSASASPASCAANRIDSFATTVEPARLMDSGSAGDVAVNMQTLMSSAASQPLIVRMTPSVSRPIPVTKMNCAVEQHLLESTRSEDTLAKALPALTSEDDVDPSSSDGLEDELDDLECQEYMKALTMTWEDWHMESGHSLLQDDTRLLTETDYSFGSIQDHHQLENHCATIICTESG